MRQESKPFTFIDIVLAMSITGIMLGFLVQQLLDF
jgi:hypothetical protein